MTANQQGPNTQHPTPNTVGLVGVGAMGSRMGRNLVKRGFELVICDTAPERTRALEGPRVSVASTPREVARRARRVITMLPSLKAIEQVILGPDDGLVAGAGPGSVVIDMSTSVPSLTRRLADELGARGIQMLDSPVSGTTPAAEDATLVAMVGGEAKVVEDCRPVLEAMCKQLYHCGGPGQGNAMKLAINLLVYVPVLAAFEANALVAKTGLDPRMFLDVIRSGAAKSYIVEYKLGKALEQDYEPGGSVDVAVKDLELALQLAHEAGVPMLLPPLAYQVFSFVRDLGLGDRDTAIVPSLYEKLLNAGGVPSS